MNFQNRSGGFTARYRLEEALSLGILALLTLLLLFRGAWKAPDIFALNISLILFILAVPYFHRRLPAPWFAFARDWYVIPLMLIIYLEHLRLVPLVNPHDVDALLIRADRFLFLGSDPTVLLESVTLPTVTELLQIVYATFYFLPFAICLIVYRRGDPDDFHVVASTLMAGFYLSYAGYYLTPAIGPRFTLNHLQHFPLSGPYTYGFVRDLVFAVEGMMRDCCPSGHALASLLTVLLAARRSRAFTLVSAVWAALLIYSTVYLRYHYVVDLVYGMALAVVVFYLVPPLARPFIPVDGAARAGLDGSGAEASLR